MSAVKIGLNLFFHSAIYTCKCAYLNFGNSTPPQFASAQWSLLRLWQLENEEMEAAWQVPVNSLCAIYKGADQPLRLFQVKNER
jgi:hypothetical protein